MIILKMKWQKQFNYNNVITKRKIIYLFLEQKHIYNTNP